MLGKWRLDEARAAPRKSNGGSMNAGPRKSEEGEFGFTGNGKKPLRVLAGKSLGKDADPGCVCVCVRWW